MQSPRRLINSAIPLLTVVALAVTGCGASSDGETVSANLGDLPQSVELSTLSGKEIGNSGCKFEENVQTETGQIGVGANIRFFCGDEYSDGAVFVPGGPEFHGEEFESGTNCTKSDGNSSAQCTLVTAGYGIEATGGDENQALSRLEATAVVLRAE